MASMGDHDVLPLVKPATYVHVQEHSGNKITFRVGASSQRATRRTVPQWLLFLLAFLLVLILVALVLRG